MLEERRGARYTKTMANIFDYIIPIALLAVLAVLLAGLWNMMRGGSASRSQTLMRWRVLLQFAAILIIMAAFYFAGR